MHTGLSGLTEEYYFEWGKGSNGRKSTRKEKKILEREEKLAEEHRALVERINLSENNISKRDDRVACSHKGETKAYGNRRKEKEAVPSVDLK